MILAVSNNPFRAHPVGNKPRVNPGICIAPWGGSEVKLCSCPQCGGTQFKDHNAIEQLIEDIAPVRPHVTRLTTYHATCVGCGQSVRSQLEGPRIK
jgi:hypothetical protein